MTSSNEILSLVRRALDEFEDKPLEASTRRAMRIANLLGESQIAVRLSLELRPPIGQPEANGTTIKRLLPDAANWEDPDGPAVKAMLEWFEDRKKPDESGHAVAYSLSDLEFWLETDLTRFMNAEQTLELLPVDLHQRQILGLMRQRIFAILCGWERSLTYASTNERIFNRFQATVDALLAEGAPALLDQFNAVYRRLREATEQASSEVNEEVAQAVTSCRRILKAVADHVYPPADLSPDGHVLDDERYRNRIKEFTRQTIKSESIREATTASIAGVYERFAAIDKLANKGVHATLALAEAELCAIHTYLLAGELLRLASSG